jgi:glycosyltransferase involved in cell wall biosynthesis
VPNELPSGCDAEAFNALIAAGSPRSRPELVTAVGFCMYVRREVFTRIGWLDELSFGRGYGEENDFCARAVKAGFRIRLCDDLFVFHEGHASFGTEGEAKFHKHLTALESKHPGFILDTFRFVKNNTLHGVLSGIKAHLRRRPFAAEPALLVVLHADPFRVDAGGTEHHILDRVAALSFPRVVLLYPQTADCVRAAEIFNGQTTDPLFYSFPLRTPLERFSLRHAEAEDLLPYVARTFRAAAVDLEHLLWWPLAAVERLREAGLPYTCSVHDFYGLCPKWNLLGPAKRMCRLNAEAPESCDACLEDLFRRLGRLPPLLTQDFLRSHLSTHRKLFGAVLAGAQCTVFPSESARRQVETFYADLSLKTRVIPHGLRHEPTAAKRDAKPSRRLRVALIGNVAEEIKGRDLIAEIIRRSANLPVEWHFFGNAEFGGLGTSSAEAKTTMVFHGSYQRHDIIGLLTASGADVALFTSLCPETFSFTLSEAWCAGIPAIAPRLGALGERVEQTGFGWLVEPYSAEAVVELLRRLTRDRAEVRALQTKLADFQHPTLRENAAAYREIYEPLLHRPEPVPGYPPHLLTKHLEIPPPPPDKESKK